MTDILALNEWAEAMAAASPELDDRDRRVAVATYKLLAEGEPLAPGRVAESAGVSTGAVEERLRSWPLVFWDNDAHVIGFWGLAVYRLEPTHSLQVAERTVYAWCAFDTLFIPPILGTEARVGSVDPRDGTPIALTVGPDGVADLRPAGTVVSLLAPEGDFGPDTIGSFCHRIHFFSSPGSAREWIGGRPGMFSIPVEEAYRLGQRFNRARLGDGVGEDVA